MKLITRFELAALGKRELHGLYRKTFNELATTHVDSQDRRNALASLENIQRELCNRP